MKIRKNILPRRAVDVFCFLLVAVFLPVIYIFEMTVVLPAFHEAGGFLHTFTFIIGIFIVFNIKGNMLACMLIDTGVDFETIEPPENAKELGWRFCDKCQKMTPPRAWHCKVCRTCILKRDHHCLFTGCCVGHRNHRFFMLFVVYMFIGSIYAFIYNSLYLWVLNSKKYWNILSLLKIVCPALYLMTGSIWHEQNLYLIFYSLNILAILYSVLLLAYHGQIILKGGVCFDRDKEYPYNVGWKENLRVVFGNRGYLTWLSPFVKSDLPHDGYYWEKKKTTEVKKNK